MSTRKPKMTVDLAVAKIASKKLYDIPDNPTSDDLSKIMTENRLDFFESRGQNWDIREHPFKPTMRLLEHLPGGDENIIQAVGLGLASPLAVWDDLTLEDYLWVVKNMLPKGYKVVKA